MEVLKLENIGFNYGNKKVLDNVNYTFESGKIYAIAGKSGAGKTTLLSLISGLATPKNGTIYFHDTDIRSYDSYEYRGKKIGIIFQSFNLLANLTAAENVVLTMDIAGVKAADKKKKAKELLEQVGLNEDEANRRVLKLSGGQQQRVAVARALATDAEVILADEPTGNLDEETQEEILQTFRRLAEAGKCVIVITHSPRVTEAADQVYRLSAIK
ncbi:ABC transporter ATP-binding protein [Hespellia stercorisuis]|uniref:Putative ABC transport system ATP-binding protein n=1 Tax=Hespellia stercorisuis DSM 15480 TaxID=1121950 RepID=A0A1M6MGC1_9FIRM|nr:ABC transporter ATP-binding protein [Hespellia stercorisuis]SHJ82519.1 putative ABC transport system ATP-binding protein [Hespellia stercorisuis DSM 15480]